MSDARAGALVFFGATGDLAYRMILPSLHAMVKRGHLDAPVIGVAKSGWILGSERMFGDLKLAVEQYQRISSRT